jgi:ADP-ribosylglycohydrolase
MDRRSRYRGALLGLAAGDALGTTVEFEAPGSFQPLTTIVGGGPFDLKPGEWTDDTTMALCMAESLAELGRFDMVDQLERYCRWWNHGHLSVKGRCFDIGGTTRTALAAFEETGDGHSGSTHSWASGNGCIMRLAPAPLYRGRNIRQAIHFAAESSKTTHGNIDCVDACRFMAAIIVGAIDGKAKDALLSGSYWESLGIEQPLGPNIAAISAGSFKLKEPPEIQGGGYVVRSLEAALWAFHKCNNFRDGALLAVNLGDDSDTTGAVYGQIAGAYYGEEGIPKEWRDILAMRDLIERRADELFALAEKNA